jgi:dTDP-4-dehydrorhamnose reductase
MLLSFKRRGLLEKYMESDKVAIIGANGQLGTDLNAVLQNSYETIPLTHNNIEVSDKQSVNKILDEYSPDVVVNTAAIHDLEECEKRPEESSLVNGLGQRYLSEWCELNDSKPIYISTDYVFDGQQQKPYTEHDCAKPVNTYGLTKLMGEYFTSITSTSCNIIRTSGLYGTTPCRGKDSHNFVEMFIDLVKEKDRIKFGGSEVTSPTFTVNLANQIDKIIKSDIDGIFHAVSRGETSWFDFGKEIINQLDFCVTMEKRTTPFEEEISRPQYSVLKNKRLQEHEIEEMKHWKENLSNYLEITGRK